MSYSEDDVLSNYRKEYAECSRYYLDERDGVRYKVMIIGNQAWLAENLRYKHVESFSFDNDEANDVLHNNGIYQESMAMQILNAANQRIRSRFRAKDRSVFFGKSIVISSKQSEMAFLEQ